MSHDNSTKVNFITLLMLFFGWGLVTCLNDLLTPILKQVFELSQFEANFVAFAFFIAYFVGSLVYVFCSMWGIKFFVNLGYKGLIILGLILSAVGCLLFIPASIYHSYMVFLFGLFCIGFGFTFLQIAANPLALILGDKESGASRLNLAQGFNSLATTISPLLGVYVFYKLLDVIHNQNNLSYPYLFLTLFFLFLAYLVYRYLNVKDLDVELHHGKVPPFALNHLNLIFGALAVFFYVGSEVSIGTNLVAYIKSDSALNLSTSTSGKLLAFYWGGSMIGRFLGGVALNQTIKLLNKFLLMVIIAISLTLLIIYVGGLTGLSLKYYLWFEALAIILFMLSRNVRVNVILFSIVNIASLIIGIVNHENQWLSVWVILAIGLFNSVMWSNIFDLALANLGKYKEQGSSFLVMMILGGAIIPIIQGRVADLTNIQSSFYVPLIGYCYILGYALFYTTKQIKLIK